MISNLSRYALLLPLCFGVFIAADDMTVVVTLLPEMMKDLRVGINELDRASWAVTAYLIGYTAAMPIMGRLSDRHGYRRAFLIAMTIFTCGSALVAISPNIPAWLYGGQPELSWMILMRVLQATGGGALIPIALAATTELLPNTHRAIAFGLIGASAEAGAEGTEGEAKAAESDKKEDEKGDKKEVDKNKKEEKKPIAEKK